MGKMSRISSGSARVMTDETHGGLNAPGMNNHQSSKRRAANAAQAANGNLARGIRRHDTPGGMLRRALIERINEAVDRRKCAN